MAISRRARPDLDRRLVALVNSLAPLFGEIDARSLRMRDHGHARNDVMRDAFRHHSKRASSRCRRRYAPSRRASRREGRGSRKRPMRATTRRSCGVENAAKPPLRPVCRSPRSGADEGAGALREQLKPALDRCGGHRENRVAHRARSASR